MTTPGGTMSIGHNAGASENGDLLSDDEEVSFFYIQLHLGDYVKETAEMTPEQEGIYARFLVYLHRNGKPFSDNDIKIAKLLRLSTRIWRRVKETLIGLGMIIARNGCLTNEWFEKERQKRAAEIRKRAAAANARWHGKGAEHPMVAPTIAPTVGRNNEKSSGKFSVNSTEKTSEINETAMQVHMQMGGDMHMLSYNLNPITVKKENPGASESVAAAEPLLPQIEGFNGATTLMVTKIAKWMNPNAPAYVEARQWLVNTAQIYGNEVVRDAFAAMEAKAASGDIVAKPLVFMAKTCQGKKRDLDEQKQQKQDMAGLQNMSETTQKKILADRERAKKGENMLWT